MEYDDEQDSQVPALSAGKVHTKKHRIPKKKRGGIVVGGSKGKKPKYRDMILNAIKSQGESKGSNFGKICRFIEKKYKMKNDFVVKHTLKWLISKKVLSKNGGRYRISSPMAPSAGRRRRGTRRKKRSRGKSRRRRRRPARRRQRTRRRGRRARRGRKRRRSSTTKRRRPRRRPRRNRRARRGRARRKSR